MTVLPRRRAPERLLTVIFRSAQSPEVAASPEGLLWFAVIRAALEDLYCRPISGMGQTMLRQQDSFRFFDSVEFEFLCKLLTLNCVALRELLAKHVPAWDGLSKFYMQAPAKVLDLGDNKEGKRREKRLKAGAEIARATVLLMRRKSKNPKFVPWTTPLLKRAA